MRKLVLFDIGAVQLRLNYGKFFHYAKSLSGRGAVELKKDYDKLETKYLAIGGKNASNDFISGIKDVLHLRKDFPDEKIKKLVSYMWECQINEVLKMKTKIRDSGCYVGNFSNISELGFEMLSKEYPEIFEGCYHYPSIYSCRIGMTKNDTDLYKKIKGFDSMILIDDNEVYIRKCSEFGWKGILFTPFIDKSESIRSIHSSTTETGNFRVADSSEELEKYLKEMQAK